MGPAWATTAPAVRVEQVVVVLGVTAVARRPVLIGLRDSDGDWPSGAWSNDDDLGSSARRIMAEALACRTSPAAGRSDVDRLTATMDVHSAGFLPPDQPDAALRLIHTAALPLPAGLLDWDRWTEVSTAAGNDPVGMMARQDWVGRAAVTDDALEFLPEYFTIPDLRDVYQALWGLPLVDGNFHRWVQLNPGLLRPTQLPPMSDLRRVTVPASLRARRLTSGAGRPAVPFRRGRLRRLNVPYRLPPAWDAPAPPARRSDA